MDQAPRWKDVEHGVPRALSLHQAIEKRGKYSFGFSSPRRSLNENELLVVFKVFPKFLEEVIPLEGSTPPLDYGLHYAPII
jgi:hypothetical protein